MLHAGVLMKLGAYGILRVGVYLFPQGALAWAPIMAVLALCNILYGAMVATQQRDLKYMIGYSSVSHMGIVILGIATLTETGINGASYQMFSHGIMTALFFACVGHIYDTSHTRMMDELGGLSRKAPVISALFILAGLAGLGLPGLSGFVAEFLVTVAAVKTFPIIGFASIAGLVITAYYVLTALQRTFYGPASTASAHVTDLRGAQLFPRLFLAALLVIFGVFPDLFLGWVRLATSELLRASPV
jgi:NADH-quinone oxidoreductase subunit M